MLKFCGVDVIGYKDKIFFNPYKRNYQGYNSYYTLYLEILSSESNESIGQIVIECLSYAQKVDYYAEAQKSKNYEQTGIKSYLGILKKCKNIEVYWEDNSNFIEINSGYRKGSGIILENVAKISLPLDNPELIGEKVRIALELYKG